MLAKGKDQNQSQISAKTPNQKARRLRPTKASKSASKPPNNDAPKGDIRAMVSFETANMDYLLF
ncbi:hypothetical protein B9Q17_09915 [Marinobacter vinifirmus]|uniref:Uncharacterized protein n=1 Tax=Marinobacter vinifirmus TaxID=355591 RepID=A0A7Z1IL95_9GAMM|nr:hypothetical protein B9Q17_09915 [Marinobacter vinifirmus]